MPRFTNEQIVVFRETCLLDESLHEETNSNVPGAGVRKEALPNFVACDTWQRFVEEGFEESLNHTASTKPDPNDRQPFCG